MPIGTASRSAGVELGAHIVCPGSLRSKWAVINTDLTATPDASDVDRPWDIDGEGFLWLRVPDGATRMLLSARTALAAGMDGAATVRIIGADVDPTQTDDDGNQTGYVIADSVHFTRLDNAATRAGGVVIPIASTTTGFIDSAYVYGPCIDLTGVDLQGCRWVGCLVETAATQAGSGAVEAMARFLN